MFYKPEYTLEITRNPDVTVICLLGD